MAITQHYHAFEPAVWSPRLDFFFQKKLQAKYVCTDYSSDLNGNIVYVPGITDGFTAAAIGITSGDVTAASLADTKSTITLDQWYGDAFRVTKGQADRIGSQYNLVYSYMETMAYNLSTAFDTAVLGNISSGTFSVGKTGTAIPSTTLEHALAIADSQNMPHDGLAWVFTPNAYWQQLANVSKYYTMSTYGKATIPTGFVDMLYGIPVLVSNNLPLSATDRQNALIHKSAIGFVIAGGGVNLTYRDPEALRRTYFADIHYGHTLLTAGRIIKIVGKR